VSVQVKNLSWAGVVGWHLRGLKIKKAPDTDEVIKKSEEDTNL